MPNNVIIILTEGDHDAAFLARILKADGFLSYKAVIKDFPAPFNDFLKADITKIPIDEARIDVARKHRFLPNYVLECEENLIFIYAVGGDKKSALRTDLIKTLNAFRTSDPDALQAVDDVGLSVLYFLDADEIGISKRCAEIREELLLSMSPDFVPDVVSHGIIYEIDDLRVGSFIFSSSGSDHGKLEDILVPLMNKDNDDIFAEALKFLGIHPGSELFKDNLKLDSTGQVVQVFGNKFDLKKSLIGTVGQLEKSGKSNTVCISDSNYLNTAKLQGDPICQAIVHFIRQVLT